VLDTNETHIIIGIDEAAIKDRHEPANHRARLNHDNQKAGNEDSQADARFIRGKPSRGIRPTG
jgi:hypothetical protein